MKVLLADTDLTHRNHLRALLASWGHEVVEVASGDSALAAIAADHPRLVLTDIFEQGLDTPRLIERIKLDHPRVFVILLARPGQERAAMEALRAGAVNFLSKPADSSELRLLMDKYCSLTAAQDEERMMASMVEYSRVVLQVPTDLRFAARVSDYLLRDVSVCYPQADATALVLGLQEMIQNAIEHGNLGITYQEKTSALEQGTFADLVDQRQADPRRADRKVRVEVERDRDGVRCRIRDQGDGFNWRNLPDPLAADGLLSMHGRGIYLTRFSYDTVEYNELGNEVIIAKRLQPAF